MNLIQINVDKINVDIKKNTHLIAQFKGKIQSFNCWLILVTIRSYNYIACVFV